MIRQRTVHQVMLRQATPHATAQPYHCMVRQAMAQPRHYTIHYATPCHDKLCHAMPRKTTPRYAKPQPSHSTVCQAKAQHAIPRHNHDTNWYAKPHQTTAQPHQATVEHEVEEPIFLTIPIQNLKTGWSEFGNGMEQNEVD